MTDFSRIYQGREKLLLEAVRARAAGRAQYLAAVEEVWNQSFQGLTGTLLKADAAGTLLEPEAGPGDPVAAFGRDEAGRHRARGTSLEMFLELLKIYRPAYLDLLREAVPDEAAFSEAKDRLLRFFNRLETSFCLAWVREAEAGGIGELRARNLELLTERDRYLAVLESLPMPVILLDPDLSVRNLNHAAYRLFFREGAPGAWYYQPGQAHGAAFLTDLFPDFTKALDDFQRCGAARRELAWTALRDGEALDFRVVLARMLDEPDAYAGILVTLDDQTERLRTARERERILSELQEARAEVGKLSSLLPICAWCKKIRDDQGYWDQLEAHLAAHAGITFTHGVCPECAMKIRNGELGKTD
jgi:PAS domain-containing protein